MTEVLYWAAAIGWSWIGLAVMYYAWLRMCGWNHDASSQQVNKVFYVAS